MLRLNTLAVLVLCFVLSAGAQEQKNRDEKTAKDKYAYTREGNELYKKKQYAEAESLYVKGSMHEPDAFTTAFNLGDALYKQGKYEPARQQFDLLTKSPVSADSMALVHHNIGNCLLQQKEYAQSIEAYKKALRLNPADEESRYNLAYAQKMLKQQQQKQQQQQQQNQKPPQDEKKQDNEKNKKEQDEQQKKKDELEKKKKELEKEQQQKNQQKQENKQKQRNPATPEPERQKLEKENQKIDQRLDEIQKELEKIKQQLREMEGQGQSQPKPKPESEIKKEEARRILEALKNEEKKTREKLDKKSKNSSYPETDKDW